MSRRDHFNSRFPYLHDDSDYTTNAPSYYDDLARKSKLVQELAQRIWEYQELIDTQFAEWDEELKKRFLAWDKNLEEFDEEVMRLLREWIDDGTFAEIINEEIFSWKADKTYVDSEVTRLDDRIDLKADKTQIELNIKDFGAIGDGITDDTDAFKKAGLSGKTVIIPNGKYKVTDTVQLTDNTRLIGRGENSVITGGNGGILFRADGNYSNETPVTQNGIIGDHFITVGNTAPFSKGDDIRIISQRVATSREDSGEDWWLGVATSNSHNLHFGEVKTLSAIDDRQLFFRGGLLFPDYLTTDEHETHEKALRNSIVQKINFIENIELSGFTVDGDFGNVARLSVCKYAKVNNIKFEEMGNATMVMFYECMLSEGKNLSLIYSHNIPSNGVYSRNGLKTVSSFKCGFRECLVDNGTQSIDFTYNTSSLSIPNIDSYVENCTVKAPVNNGMTSHGGTYRTRFINNTIMDCHTDGISSRSRESIISGNTVAGSYYTRGGRGIKYGIQLYQGAAQNCIVNGNSVSGFDTGIATRSGLDSAFRYVGAIISNNSISKCTTGFAFRHGDVPMNVRSEITISNNTVSHFNGDGQGKFINIYQYIRGIRIHGNSFIGNDKTNGGIYTRGNSFDHDIRNNVFRNVSRVLWFEDVTDTETFSARNYNVWYENNDTHGLLKTDYMGNIGFHRKYMSGNLYPNDIEKGLIGYSDFRFKGVYTVDAPNSLSDKRHKENIQPEKNGLNLISQLKPVTYNFKSDENKQIKHGLIAQDFEEVIKNLGEDIGIMTKENDSYGLRYEEFIPIIIKAIQELDKRTK